MTFVLNQKADMLLNVERCSYLYVGEDNCVKAIMDGAKMVRAVKNSVLAFFICLPTVSCKSFQALLQKSADTHRVAAL